MALVVASDSIWMRVKRLQSCKDSPNKDCNYDVTVLLEYLAKTGDLAPVRQFSSDVY